MRYTELMWLGKAWWGLRRSPLCLEKRGSVDGMHPGGKAAPGRTWRIPRPQWLEAEDLKYLSDTFEGHSQYSFVNEFLKGKGQGGK